MPRSLIEKADGSARITKSTKPKTPKGENKHRRHRKSTAVQPHLSPLEESNRFYDLHLVSKKPKPASECPICYDFMRSYGFTCPNTSCYHRICDSCRDQLHENDHRCPCCRTELPGARVQRPMWAVRSVEVRFAGHLTGPGPRYGQLKYTRPR